MCINDFISYQEKQETAHTISNVDSNKLKLQKRKPNHSYCWLYRNGVLWKAATLKNTLYFENADMQ